MKAIILAAGQGTRLKKYTENLPKGMLNFAGKTLIERQIELYRSCGIYEIIVVKGYAADKIRYNDVKYYTNENYASTNMVESLFTARKEFDDDIIVSYSDILFEKRLLEGMIAANGDYLVAVDDAWKEYWIMRYGKIDFDTESLSIDENGNITELGMENPPLNNIDARYIGLLKFSRKGLLKIQEIMGEAHKNYGNKPWQKSGKPVQNAYMTDLLNAIIQTGEAVKAVRFEHGWMEFDTNEDYEKAIRAEEDATIHSVIRLR